MKNTSSWRLVGGTLLAGFILPILAGAILRSTTPSLSPEHAARRLNDPGGKAVLIDVRSRTEYDAFSLRQARSLPMDEISDRARTAEVLKDAETVFLICETGFTGSGAVRLMQRLGYRNVLNVSGGMDAWLASTAALDKTVRRKGAEAAGVTAVAWPPFDQAVIVLAAFIVKPAYQIIAIVILVLLWKRRDRDLAALKGAMLAFLIGENACAANYLFFHDQSLLMEYFHMYGMVICFGLVVYACVEAADRRAFHFSDRDRPCALLRQCGQCYKYNDAGCTLRSFLLVLIPACAVVAAIPLSGSLAYRFQEGAVFGTLSVFGQPIAYQYLEARFFPLFSLVFFGAAWSELARRKESGFGASQAWFAMGAGLLGFSLLRFFFYWGYQDQPLRADVWEEVTEFLFIILALWITMRARKTSGTLLRGNA